MALDAVPWAVGFHDAQLSPQMLRVLAFSAQGGAEGVIGALDLMVRANTPAGGSVVIGDGVGAMLNRYPGGAGEMYVARNAGDEILPTTPTTAGAARSDLVILRVDETTPGDATGPFNRFEIIPGVPPTTKKFSELGLAYPAIALARIDRPAGTATVNPANIVDLRQVARPQKDRRLDVFAWGGSNFADTVAYKAVGSTSKIDIPTWATTAKIFLTASGIRVTGGLCDGWLRGNLNGLLTLGTYYDENLVPQQGGWCRTTYSVGGKVSIPANMRGGSYAINFEAMRAGGPGRMEFVAGTTLIMDVEFDEQAASA